MFNSSGRGYPDVSLVGNNFGVWMDMWMPTDGTSASTPVWAGILTILKSELGHKLGFVNPMLY